MTTTFSELMYNKGMKKYADKKSESNSEPMITRRELAKHFKVAPDTITRWTKQGLPAYYIGKVK